MIYSFLRQIVLQFIDSKKAGVFISNLIPSEGSGHKSAFMNGKGLKINYDPRKRFIFARKSDRSQKIDLQKVKYRRVQTMLVY